MDTYTELRLYVKVLDKVVFYMSSCILWVPMNGKDTIKHAEEDGYNGSPVKVSVCKSRTGPGGKTAIMEFIQEAGYDSNLTLLNFAKSEGLITGRNPKSYFASNPDIKFDTRIFMEELATKPEILEQLYRECKPLLRSMVRQPAAGDDLFRGAETKKNSRKLLKSLYD